MHPTLDRITFLVIGLFCILQVFTYSQEERYLSDTSIYVTLSKNLLEHGSYEFNSQPHTLYPPAFPATLAILGMLGGDTSYAFYMKCIPILHALGLLAWYFLLRREIGQFPAFAGCVLAATSAQLYGFITSGVFSDSLFFFVSGCSLLAISILRQKQQKWMGWTLWGIASVFCGMTVLTRSAGLVLAVALLVWGGGAIIRRSIGSQSAHRAAIVAAFIGLAAFAAWTSWSRTTAQPEPSGSHMTSYFSQFRAADPHRPDLGQLSIGRFAQRIVSQFVIQTTHIAEVTLRIAWLSPSWYSPVAWGVILLTLYGCGLSIYTGKADLIGWYALGYLSIYALWPFDEGIRFMYPAIPMVIALMIYSFSHVFGFIRKNLSAVAAVAVPASIAVAFAVWMYESPKGLQERGFFGFWVVAPIAMLGILAAKRMWSKRFSYPWPLQGAFSLENLRCIGRYSFIILLVVVGMTQHAPHVRANLQPDRTAFRHYPAEDCALYLKNLPDGTVMASQGAIIHRLSGRHTTSFPITMDANVIFGAIERRAVRYLVVSDPVPHEYFEPNDTSRLHALQSQYPELLVEVHRGPGYRIFEVRRFREPNSIVEGRIENQ